MEMNRTNEFVLCPKNPLPNLLLILFFRPL